MDSNSLVQVIPEKQVGSDHLPESVKENLIERMYDGETLLVVCRELNIKRYQVDLAYRNDGAFKDALDSAFRALGDIKAEGALEALKMAGVPSESRLLPDGTKEEITLDERKFLLTHAKLNADYHRWFAERISDRYKPKSPEKADKKKPKMMQTNIPKREAI